MTDKQLAILLGGYRARLMYILEKIELLLPRELGKEREVKPLFDMPYIEVDFDCLDPLYNFINALDEDIDELLHNKEYSAKL